MKTHPGYCNTKTIWKEDKRLTANTISFILKHLRPAGMKIADVGEINRKKDDIERALKQKIHSIVEQDFNFPPTRATKYDIILCLEVLEHLQNPLMFMQYLQNSLTKNGMIFLSTQARPKFLWTEHHFFEMDAKHITKWLLEPLGMKIVAKKKLRINHHPLFYLSGICPFFRIFFNYTWIYLIVNE